MPLPVLRRIFLVLDISGTCARSLVWVLTLSCLRVAIITATSAAAQAAQPANLATVGIGTLACVTSRGCYISTTVDAAGNLYAIGEQTPAVYEGMLVNGSYMEIALPITLPNYGYGGIGGIAVDANGNLYIADYHGSQLLKYTLSGSTYTQSIIANSSQGLSNPLDITVAANGIVYSCDGAVADACW